MGMDCIATRYNWIYPIALALYEPMGPGAHQGKE